MQVGLVSAKLLFPYLPLPSHISQLGHFTGLGGGVESSVEAAPSLSEANETLYCWLWTRCVGTKDWTSLGRSTTLRKSPSRRLVKIPDRIVDFIVVDYILVSL